MDSNLVDTTAKVINKPLNEEFLGILSSWKQLLQSLFGPNSHPKLIQNIIGGHTTITTQFSRLVHSTQSSHPLMKLLISSAQNQIGKYGNFGIFTLLLSLNLVDKAIKLSLNTSLIADLYDKFGKIIIDHLEKSSCGCVIPIKLTCIGTLKSVIKSVLDSKPVCMLSSVETNYLTVLLLNAFLISIPNANNQEQQNCLGCINIKVQEGLSPINSKILQGLVLLAEDNDLKDLQSKSQNLIDLKLALFNISLAGDSQSAIDTLYEFQEEILAPDVLMHQQLMTLAEEIVESNVNIVACQKVIHPSLMKVLQDKGIIVIERLGEINFQHLKYLSGAKPITSLTQSIKPEYLGLIKKLQIINLYDKEYFYFQNESSSFCTIFLCNSNEESLEELKVTCNQVNDSLRILLQNPKVLIGGGCLETHLCTILKTQVITKMKDFESSGFGQGQITTVLSAFISSLKSMSKALYPDSVSLSIDPTYHHLLVENDSETTTCACGCYTNLNSNHCLPFIELDTDLTCNSVETEKILNEMQLQKMIVDVASGKVNAFKVALETCSILLKLGLVIIETG